MAMLSVFSMIGYGATLREREREISSSFFFFFFLEVKRQNSLKYIEHYPLPTHFPSFSLFAKNGMP